MSDYKFETLQLHVGRELPDPAAARCGLADAGNICGRLTNSTQDVFESS